MLRLPPPQHVDRGLLRLHSLIQRLCLFEQQHQMLVLVRYQMLLQRHRLLPLCAAITVTAITIVNAQFGGTAIFSKGTAYKLAVLRQVTVEVLQLVRPSTASMQRAAGRRVRTAHSERLNVVSREPGAGKLEVGVFRVDRAPIAVHFEVESEAVSAAQMTLLFAR